MELALENYYDEFTHDEITHDKITNDKLPTIKLLWWNYLESKAACFVARTSFSLSVFMTGQQWGKYLYAFVPKTCMWTHILLLNDYSDVHHIRIFPPYLPPLPETGRVQEEYSTNLI